MMRPLSLRRLIPFILIVLLLPACGDSADDAADTTLAPTTTTLPPTTTAAPTTTAVASTTVSEPEQAIDEYNTAWNEQDPEALLAVVTDDFVEEYHWYTQLDDHVSVGTDSWGATGAASYAASSDFQIELSGEAIVVGDGPWFVSVAESQTGGGNAYEGTTAYVVVDDDGTLKLARKSWVGSRQPVTE
jgi:hypothetical protein